MKACPKCGRSIEDDSVFCGFCDAKQPYIPEEERETIAGESAGADQAAGVPPPAAWRCENCGEQLEASFDTCWKCGAVRAKAAENPPAGEEEETAGPLLSVWGLDKRVEVYKDKVFVAPSGAPGLSGEAGYVAPCEIPISAIVSINFTNAKEFVPGCLEVNYTEPPPEDSVTAVSQSESVRFGAAANPEMAKAMDLIKRCRLDLDAQGQE